jgi:hypothetical protein
MGEYKGYLVQPKDIHRIWEHIEPLIQDGINSIKENQKLHYLTTADFRKWFHEALVQLFIITKNKQLKLIACTEIADHGGRFKIMHCMLISGKELDKCYEELQRVTEEFANREECMRMVMHARKGMFKYLSKLDWIEIHDKHRITMMKDL